MFSPKLYTVRKYGLQFLIQHDFNINLSNGELNHFNIQQQDNSLFRQIRLITGRTAQFNPYVIFVDCRSGKSKTELLSRLIMEGVTINGTHYVMSERSASMTRVGIVSFVDESIEAELVERITLGCKPEKLVLSKYYAYRGLMFSSCHCLEGYLPKIIIVPDCFRTIPGQKIKYAYDKEIEFVDKEGNQRTWVQKEIGEDVRDLTINAFDGCGIHHPEISRQIEGLLQSDTPMTSVVWRAPFIKGVTHELDYERFFGERGITSIMDVWGISHSISEPMIIMTESMYKGKSYMATYHDARDWEEYWRRFRQYKHCIGISKWNFSVEEEPVYTRGNYQILQDLQLPYEKFASLAKFSVDLVQRIIDGDEFYTYCFLGMTADRHKPLNAYCRAVLKNPEMLKEYGVRQYLNSLLEKTKNEMKCGKLWLRACFKFFAPDLLMMLEHIGGLPIHGCLEADEFYTRDKAGVYHGEYLITRNPHIARSEHTLLNAVSNLFTEEYCGHLANVCMVNGKSITPQRLNGADYDGDLVLVIDDETMKAGVERGISVVIDVEDKITALAEEDSKEARLALVLRTMNSLIGETSNCATGYHNKVPKTQEQRAVYDGYVDLLSIINGKAIDYAKTGVIFNIPRHIAKYSKPLPYFMKYASEYYGRQHKFNHSHSNMNRLCKELEKWDRSFRYKRTFKDFDYTVMIDEAIPLDQERFEQVEQIFLQFCKEMAQLAKDQHSIRAEGYNFVMNWEYYYDQFRQKCREVCPNQKELANYAVLLCYEKHPNKNKKFLWRVAEQGILENIRQVSFPLPQRDDAGDLEYLGKKYVMKPITTEVLTIDQRDA